MTTQFSRSLCWIRRDLRLNDHHSLYLACQNSLEVVVVFVFDVNILGKLNSKSDRRVNFIFNALEDLKLKLEKRGSSLVIRIGDPREVIPALAQELSAQAVFTNEDYEPYAKKRDQSVAEKLKRANVEFLKSKDHVIFSSKEVLKKDGSPYKVFTPYKNAWIEKLRDEEITSYPPDLKRLVPKSKIASFIKKISLKEIGFEPVADTPKATEDSAKALLREFVVRMKDYSTLRDFPAANGTSGLSVHLRFGTVSIRECLAMAQKNLSVGAQVWRSELIWREFYHMILDLNPNVTKESFLPQYRNLKWPGKPKHFRAWCEGQTGYPIVDAAMRQLNQTGLMHNRLRMIVASFLVKDLLIDWRKGEAYFAEKLLDFDLAANNGGWQWCASTGCDAQPYFRIFNPVSQSVKFDPEGDFIRRFVPELKDIDDKQIHQPWAWPRSELPANFTLGRSYPRPIVDHSAQRVLASRLYRQKR